MRAAARFLSVGFRRPSTRSSIIPHSGYPLLSPIPIGDLAPALVLKGLYDAAKIEGVGFYFTRSRQVPPYVVSSKLEIFGTKIAFRGFRPVFADANEFYAPTSEDMRDNSYRTMSLTEASFALKWYGGSIDVIASKCLGGISFVGRNGIIYVVNSEKYDKINGADLANEVIDKLRCGRQIECRKSYPVTRQEQLAAKGDFLGAMKEVWAVPLGRSFEKVR